jgi:Cytochrome bd terminal oxidase subunit II
MTHIEPSSMALFWAGVIAVAILVYVILDGFDLGVGVLFGTTRQAQLRSQMIAAISPFWDGNETWLVVIGETLKKIARDVVTECRKIRNQVDAIWNALWSGGIANPLEVIDD